MTQFTESQLCNNSDLFAADFVTAKFCLCSTTIALLLLNVKSEKEFMLAILHSQ